MFFIPRIQICFFERLFVSLLRKVNTKTKRYIQLVLCVATMLVIGTSMLLNSPKVQRKMSATIASELENHIGTRVEIGGVHWLFPNDIVVDSLSIDDQEGEKLFSARRIAAKMEWKPLISKRQISIRNIRIFHPKLTIYRDHSEGETNYQFLADAFAAKEKRKKTTKLNLRINSLLIKHADFRYDILSAKKQPGKLCPDHICIEDLSAHLSLKALTGDSISLMMRELNFKEQSGMRVNDLYFRLVGNRQGATLANFHLELPHSTLLLDTLWASYSPHNFTESLIIKGAILPSRITPSDLGALVPSVKGFTERIHLSGEAIGSKERINIRHIALHTHNKDLTLQAHATAHLGHSLEFELGTLNVTPNVWDLLAEQLPQAYAYIPTEVTRIGNIAANGSVSLSHTDSHVNIEARTDAGALNVLANIDGAEHYTASVNGTDINIARIIPTSPLTQTNIALQTTGTYDKQAPKSTLPLRGTVTGTATDIEINAYTYKRLALNGSYSPNQYEGSATLDDPNGSVILDATYTRSGRVPSYQLKVKADSLNLHAMNLISIHQDKSFSFKMNSDIHGHSLNHLTGKVSIDSLTLHDPEGDYLVRQIALYSSDPRQKALSLQSDFINGSINGSFDYKSLRNSLIAHSHNYLPVLCHKLKHDNVTTQNQCAANFEIRDTRPLQKFLLLPIANTKAINIRGYLYDHTKEIGLSVLAPSLMYNENEINNLSILCDNSHDGFSINAGAIIANREGVNHSASLIANAHDDNINLGITWNSSPEHFFEGSLYANAHFDYTDEDDLRITIESDSSQAIINHSAWDLTPFKAIITPQQTAIHNFFFEKDSTQYLKIDGNIANTTTDTLQVELRNIDLSYLLSIAQLKGIDFGGNINGHIKAANLYASNPYLDASIKASSFSFCDGTMGDTYAHAYWNQDSTRLDFIADIHENLRHTTHVDGHVDLANKRLHIGLDADSTNIAFLNSLLKTFMSDVKGSAYGHVNIGGPLDAIDIEGKLLADATFKLTPTNSEYHFRDTLTLLPGKILFENITLHDKNNHEGYVNGTVSHKSLKDFGVDLNVDAHNIKGINLPDTGNDNFYTTIYGTGNVNVNAGPNNPLHININARTEKGSLFALNLASQNESSSEAFITFRDRTPKRSYRNEYNQPLSGRRRPPISNDTPTKLDITANITQDATLKLVMNQAVDDHISVNGNGEIQILIDGDEISLFGTYNVNRGFYRLNLQDVINKNFEVLAGSTITFGGDPMNAQLNITACHTVNYVPLKDLSPEAKGNVHVNCLLHIGGSLNSPTLNFDLNLPQGTEEEKTILRSFTSTEEQMNLQFIYLLGLGRFYTQDMNQNGQNAGMESLVSSTISGQINNLLSSIIDNDKWNFSSNIRTENLLGETTTDLRENMEIEGMLEGHLLDNRLIINGNFGYRENPMYASNFIGDFDIRYLLNNDFSIKGYSKTNDRYFTKTSLTTQGIGLLFQHDFDNWFPYLRKTSKEKYTFKESTYTQSPETGDSIHAQPDVLAQ